jgi:hypothetical protein
MPIPPPESQLSRLLVSNFMVSCTLFDRETYERAGAFRDRYRWAEDWDLWIRMRRTGAVITTCPTPTVLYRKSPESLTAKDERIEDEVGVLTAALSEATTADERRAAVRGLRKVRGNASLLLAYRAARAGESGKARALALRAFAGRPRVVARAAFMLIAPRMGAAIADRQRVRSRWMLRR